MSIPIFKFKEPTKERPNNPFPSELYEDPMVLYHGTSNMNEHSIEENGFETNKSEFSLEEILEVCTLFDCVNWPNKKFWSENNLRNYSLKHDFERPDLKPVYFGECSERVSLYASSDFAGGEIARAIRNTFQELNALIYDPKELENELATIEKDFPFTHKRADDYDLGLERLKINLMKKKWLLDKAELIRKKFDYGLIYAVKFEPNDLPFIEHSIRSGMGVKCFCRINKGQIVAKTVVPKDYVHNSHAFVNYWGLPSWNGILSKVKNDIKTSI